MSALSPWRAHRGDHGCGDAGKGGLACLLKTGLDDNLLAPGAASRQRARPHKGGALGRCRTMMTS